MQVVSVKYQLPPLAKMSDEMALGHLQGMLKRIKVITGWQLPELKEDRQILCMELLLHFRENWTTINPEEIAFAFRKYGSVVKSWGKDINLVLMDEILGKYMKERMAVSEREMQKREHQQNEKFKMDWVSYAEGCFQNVRSGNYNIGFWMDDLFDVLAKDGFIGALSWERYMDDSKRMLFAQYRRLEDEYRASRDYSMCKYISDKIEALMSETDALLDIQATAKKICVEAWFKKLISDGVKTIIKKDIENGKDM